MDNPAVVARRLLLAIATALFLVSFLALREGRLPLEFNIGWSIPIMALFFLGLGLSVPMDSSAEGLLARWFPAMDEGSLAEEIQNEVEKGLKDENLGGAWAQLEEAMLTENLGESE
ncbi:MAG: hypothetical protein ACKVHH_02050 [Candidatus Poseidoniales archaeon]|jgi:hypothetical protein|tara:strand:- start:630 stop:977 length:348 start_codon:yes stop_codon:yes gene_type:complete